MFCRVLLLLLLRPAVKVLLMSTLVENMRRRIFLSQLESVYVGNVHVCVCTGVELILFFSWRIL